MKIAATGGAGFIGSVLIRHLIIHMDHQVVNIVKLTYAGHLESLESVSNSDCFTGIHKLCWIYLFWTLLTHQTTSSSPKKSQQHVFICTSINYKNLKTV